MVCANEMTQDGDWPCQKDQPCDWSHVILQDQQEKKGLETEPCGQWLNQSCLGNEASIKTPGNEAQGCRWIPLVSSTLGRLPHLEATRGTLSPSHWSARYNSPDKIQGLLFVHASRMSPFPVQKVAFIGAAEVLWRTAEVALGSRSKQMSITITTCSCVLLIKCGTNTSQSFVNKGSLFAGRDENTM